MNIELKPVANKLTNVAKLLTNIGIAKHLLPPPGPLHTGVENLVPQRG